MKDERSRRIILIIVLAPTIIFLFIFGAVAALFNSETGEFVYNGIAPGAYDSPTFAALMNEAVKYIGMPYVYGGSSPSTSFDCSGYICWVYTQSGVYNLPRTTAQGIYNQCTPIPPGEAMPGDLIFFHSTYVHPDTVTHVGIYVGDGTMLHCGNPIGYANVNSSYWTSKFYAYGRLTNK